MKEHLNSHMFSQISAFFSELRLTSCGSYKKRPKGTKNGKSPFDKNKKTASLNDLSNKSNLRSQKEKNHSQHFSLSNSSHRNYESDLNLQSSSTNKKSRNIEQTNHTNHSHLNSKNQTDPTTSNINSGSLKPHIELKRKYSDNDNIVKPSTNESNSIKEKDSFFDYSEHLNQKNKYAMITKHSSNMNLNSEQTPMKYNAYLDTITSSEYLTKLSTGVSVTNSPESTLNQYNNIYKERKVKTYDKISERGMDHLDAGRPIINDGISTNNVILSHIVNGGYNDDQINLLVMEKNIDKFNKNNDSKPNNYILDPKSTQNPSDYIIKRTINTDGYMDNKTLIVNNENNINAINVNGGKQNIFSICNKNSNRQISYGSNMNLLNLCNEQNKFSVSDLTKSNDLLDQEYYNVIKDNKSGVYYLRGKLLGKGGFAYCYELKDLRTKNIFAGKIIPRTRLKKPVELEKVNREIELHSRLNHVNVVKFYSSFDDDKNIYIVLENCSMKTLVHMVKKRRILTEPEVRYFMLQLRDGLQYIHRQHIIHRDLKLGNMLLNDTMRLKVADFGLATYVSYPGEKKMTVCGTPNYIAPEVLQKLGHSYEADIWSMGCIMYALLCGRPPFETTTLKETYLRIVSNLYTIPHHVSISARKLISKLLDNNPSLRPDLPSLMDDSFFSDGFLPESLTTLCMNKPPRYPLANITVQSKNLKQGYFTKKNSNELMKSASQLHLKTKNGEMTYIADQKNYLDVGSAPNLAFHSQNKKNYNLSPAQILLQEFSDIYNLTTRYMNGKRNLEGLIILTDEPLVYIVKWVDYSNKYGFGFQLSNQHVGILFNNKTKMLLSEDAKTIYVQSQEFGVDIVSSYSVRNIPSELQKNATLLLYFTQFMEKHLIPGGLASQPPAHHNSIVFLRQWFRTEKAIVLMLSNNTFQVNFFEDHAKVIITCSDPNRLELLKLAVVDGESRDIKFLDIHRLKREGCSPWLRDKLGYALHMLESMVEELNEIIKPIDTRV